jgi:uncharacterized protein (DUF488 family)
MSNRKHVPEARTTAFTVGHSTRPIEELLDMLRGSGVRLLVDVRRYPVSRRYPHFSRPALSASLAAAGIDYGHEVDLGGHREPAPGSPNTAWRAAAFRGYADHMATPAFAAALARLEEAAAARPTAVLCAEADPTKCHRQLVADALVARGARVVHILGPGRTEDHVIHPAARVTPRGGIVYGPPPLLTGP